METYQPIYDAVRSRLGNCDIASAVADIARQNLDVSCLIHQAQNAISSVECESIRPSILFRPRVSIDGDSWIALYGDNLQDGVAGIGQSPDEAMRDFDNNWAKKLERKS